MPSSLTSSPASDRYTSPASEPRFDAGAVRGRVRPVASVRRHLFYGREQRPDPARTACAFGQDPGDARHDLVFLACELEDRWPLVRSVPRKARRLPLPERTFLGSPYCVFRVAMAHGAPVVSWLKKSTDLGDSHVLTTCAAVGFKHSVDTQHRFRTGTHLLSSLSSYVKFGNSTSTFNCFMLHRRVAESTAPTYKYLYTGRSCCFLGCSAASTPPFDLSQPETCAAHTATSPT
jgi:hypothetical protein